MPKQPGSRQKPTAKSSFRTRSRPRRMGICPPQDTQRDRKNGPTWIPESSALDNLVRVKLASIRDSIQKTRRSEAEERVNCDLHAAERKNSGLEKHLHPFLLAIA